MLMNRHFLHLN